MEFETVLIVFVPTNVLHTFRSRFKLAKHLIEEIHRFVRQVDTKIK